MIAFVSDRRGHGHGRDSRQPSDEEYDTADNASVISSMSDGASVNGEGIVAQSVLIFVSPCGHFEVDDSDLYRSVSFQMA